MVNEASSSGNYKRNTNNNHQNNESRPPRRNFQGNANGSANANPNARRRNNHSNLSNNNNNKFKRNEAREVNMSGYGKMISQIEENFSDIKIVGDYTEECTICCKKSDVFGLGNCRHPVCIECAIRIRVISNQNVCPVCRTELDTCSFMWCTKDFSFAHLATAKLGHKDEDRFKVRFQTRDVLDRYNQYLAHTCKKCVNDDGSRLSFSKFQALRQHMLSAHQLTYCKLCTDNLSTFSREWKTYSRTELSRHTADGDGDYSKAQYKHLRTDHFYCQICETNPETSNTFFKEHPELIRHYEKSHFVCHVPDCKNAGIVFKTSIELSLHESSEHSKKAFNLFNDRPSDRGDRRNRGRQQAAPPPPPPPPEPPRRNVEVVVVRSAQSAGTTIVGRNRFNDMTNDFPSLPNAGPIPAHERVVVPSEFPRLSRVGRPNQPKPAQPRSVEEEFPTLGGRPSRPATTPATNSTSENWRRHTGAFDLIDDDERAGSMSQPASVARPVARTAPAVAKPSTSKPATKKPTPPAPVHTEDFPALPSTSALASNSSWAAKTKKSAITGVKMPNKKSNLPVPDMWPTRPVSTPYEPPTPEEWKEVPVTKKLTKREKREQQKMLEEAALREAEQRAQDELVEKRRREAEEVAEAEADAAHKLQQEAADVDLQTAILRDIQSSSGKKENNSKGKNKKKKKADTADVVVEPKEEKKPSTQNSFLNNAEHGCDFKKLKAEADAPKSDPKPTEETEQSPDMVSWFLSSVSQKFSGLSLSNIMGKNAAAPLSSLPSTPVTPGNTSVYETPSSVCYATPPGLARTPAQQQQPQPSVQPTAQPSASIVYTAPPGFENMLPPPGLQPTGATKQTQMFSMAPFISDSDVKKPKAAEPKTAENIDGWLQQKK
ncbi:unnamed protein product [Auanema sp. JU1783]|nr:unnamed protein product [Auanema sp. JU1783]